MIYIINQYHNQKKLNFSSTDDSYDEIDEILSNIDINTMTHDEFLKIIRSKC